METIHLIGADDVVRGGHLVNQGADTMMGAANNMAQSVDRLYFLMTEHTEAMNNLALQIEKLTNKSKRSFWSWK